MQVPQLLQSEKPSFKTAADAIVAVVHLTFLANDFRLTGLAEPLTDTAAVFPSSWNSTSELYTFRYRHPKSDLSFLMKIIVMGRTVLVHATTEETGKVLSVNLKYGFCIYVTHY